MDAPMDPCLGRASTSLMPVPATVASASRTSATPYPTWWMPSPHARHGHRRRPDPEHRLAHALLLVDLQARHLEAERGLVQRHGPVQVAAGDADVVEAGQQR